MSEGVEGWSSQLRKNSGAEKYGAIARDKVHPTVTRNARMLLRRAQPNNDAVWVPGGGRG